MEYLLNQEMLKRHCGLVSFLRGQDYFKQNRVWNLRGADNRITGEVKGSNSRPYNTKITLGEKEIKSSSCSCPLDGACKHVAALGLTMIFAYVEDITKTIAVSYEGNNAVVSEYKETPPEELWKKNIGKFFGFSQEEDCATQRKQSYGHAELLFRLARGKENTSKIHLEIRPRIFYPSRASSLTDITWNKVTESYSWESLPLPRLELFYLRSLARIMTETTGWYHHVSSTWMEIEDKQSDVFWGLLKDHERYGIKLCAGKKGECEVKISERPVSEILVMKDIDAGVVLKKQFVMQTNDDGASKKEIPRDQIALIGDPVAFAAVIESGPALSIENAEFLLHPFENGKAKKSHEKNEKIVVPNAGISELQKNYLPQLMRTHKVESESKKVVAPQYAHSELLIEIAPKKQTKKTAQGIRLNLAFRYQGIKKPLHEKRETIETKKGNFIVSPEEEADLLKKTGAILMPFSEAWKSAGAWTNDTMIAPVPILHETFDMEGVAAARFMTETLPRLKEEDGIAVETSDKLPEFVFDASAPTVEFSVLKKGDERDWFDLAIIVSIGGEEVPFTDLFTALSGDEEYLLLPSGRYFSLRQNTFDELRRLIKEARGVSDITEKGITISRFQTGFWNELQTLGIVKQQSAEWENHLAGLRNSTGVSMVEPSPSLRANLRDYQKTGFSWLKFLYDNEMGGVLGDDMGLGKTMQALALLIHASENRAKLPQKDRHPSLVVAPTSVVENWSVEFERFAPGLKIVVMRAGNREEEFQKLRDKKTDVDVVLTSYALLVRDFEELSPFFFDLVILDEAQFVKNYQSKAYSNIRQIDTSRRFALTGTPMENNVMELWSIFSIVAPGLFGNPEHFREHFQKPIEKDSSTEHVKRLQSRIRPFFMRRTKELVAKDLPTKTEQVLFVELDPKHKQLYDLHLQRERQRVLGLLAEEGGMRKNRFVILQSLMKMRQLALHPALVGSEHKKIPSSKLESLLEQVETLTAGGHKALIFSQFTSYLAHIKEMLEKNKIDFAYLDGSTKDRASQIEKFQKNETTKIFLISLKAGGFGLNLTAADYCFIMDPWWNPAVESQAAARAHRIGQTKNVFVYKMIAKDTIEEKVLKLQEKKKALFDNIIEDDAKFGSLITEKDIRGLFE